MWRDSRIVTSRELLAVFIILKLGSDIAGTVTLVGMGGGGREQLSTGEDGRAFYQYTGNYPPTVTSFL